MKKIILAIIICLVISSCQTTKTNNTVEKRDLKVIQAEFNQDAAYFIQKDGARLEEYLDKDQTLSLREKEPTKRRLINLNKLIIQLQEAQK